MRRPSYLAISVLVAAVAITPLTAIFRPGYFEYRFPATVREPGRGFGHHVSLEDWTGLIAGIAPAHTTELAAEVKSGVAATSCS